MTFRKGRKLERTPQRTVPRHPAGNREGHARWIVLVLPNGKLGVAVEFELLPFALYLEVLGRVSRLSFTYALLPALTLTFTSTTRKFTWRVMPECFSEKSLKEQTFTPPGEKVY